MQEWTDPRYQSAVDTLTAARSTAPAEAAKRCRGCLGYGARLMLVSGGGQIRIGCTRCGETGQQPAPAPRRRS
ncbi:hypothetical protein [Streptomyces sp. T028]|uniref:hypothetical protein n=1 Tax=Streptomyces sp. T028 TaxID=3394379 RepID=UPI003A851503